MATCIFGFQDANGSMGLTTEGIQNRPVQVLQNQQVIKIASGGDHLVCLTNNGEIYTCGKYSLLLTEITVSQKSSKLLPCN